MFVKTFGLPAFLTLLISRKYNIKKCKYFSLVLENRGQNGFIKNDTYDQRRQEVEEEVRDPFSSSSSFK
jgi:hypothetical protein